MAELVVTGPHESQRLRFPVPAGRVQVLGRGEQADLVVPWDLLISRRHAEICWQGDRLTVHRLESGRNPIFYRGTDKPHFELPLGEEFLIGKTRFQFVAPVPESAEPPGSPEDFGEEMLTNVVFQNANRWLEVLSQLPAAMAESTSDTQFAQKVVSMLLQILPRVETAAVVDFQEMDSETAARFQMLCWDSRRADQTRFDISRKMIQESVLRQEGLVHIWNSQEPAEEDRIGTYTHTGRFDWSFCVPVTQEAGWGWCLSMSGNLDSELMPIIQGREELREELRFAELLGQFVGSLRELRSLESRQAGLIQFFPPPIREMISQSPEESVLQPRECEISVLFCQLREPASAAWQRKLSELSDSVDHCFRVMSESIFQHAGVMADFQGESSMAFWGWPVPAPEGPLAACRAALDIQRAQKRSPQLAKTRLSCGIAHGAGLAGKIGPGDQYKMGVFGPVVNLGSRLKGLAQHIRTPILMAGPIAEYARMHLPRSEGRCRKIGQFRPSGMEQPSTVYELLGPVDEDPAISDQHLADFEAAVELISEGDWDQAKDLLHALPAEDPCKHFLITMIALYDYAPPPGWDGVFSLLSK